MCLGLEIRDPTKTYSGSRIQGSNRPRRRICNTDRYTVCKCLNFQAGIRPICPDSPLVSPCDGLLLNCGTVDTHTGQIHQVKGGTSFIFLKILFLNYGLVWVARLIFTYRTYESGPAFPKKVWFRIFSLKIYDKSFFIDI